MSNENPAQILRFVRESGGHDLSCYSFSKGAEMAKPTPWTPAKDGLGETRKSGQGNTVHRQWTPDGHKEHVNRKDGSSVRPTSPTTDPQNPKKKQQK